MMKCQIAVLLALNDSVVTLKKIYWNMIGHEIEAFKI